VSGAHRILHIVSAVSSVPDPPTGIAALEFLAPAGRHSADAPTVHAGIVLIAHRPHR
jgi:hypothetical protein